MSINKKESSIWKLIIIIAVIILSILIVFKITYPERFTTKKYNVAIDKYNSEIIRFQKVSNESEISNIYGFLGNVGPLKKESELLIDVVISILNGNNEEKIIKDINTLEELTKEIEDEIEIAKLLINPNETFISKRLQLVKNIKDFQFVNMENDPEGLYKKPNGGYTSCVYFSVYDLDENTVEGKDLVEKGTDAGGCIEVYRNIGEAKERCEYLSSFDNTILYSGSYAVIGTMVVRTSYKFTPEEQYELTNDIFEALATKN